MSNASNDVFGVRCGAQPLTCHGCGGCVLPRQSGPAPKVAGTERSPAVGQTVVCRQSRPGSVTTTKPKGSFRFRNGAGEGTVGRVTTPPNRGGRPRGSRSKPRAASSLPENTRPRTRVVGYVRVSTERQAEEGVSLDAQQARLRAYCAAQELELVALEVDEGASAKSLSRPGLQRALEALSEGRADALLVPKLDRLTRRVVDLGHLIETYFADGRAALLSVADQIDTRTAAGRMTLFILMSVAQWEREAIGERTSEALAHLRAEGVRLGRAGLGWAHSTEVDHETGRRVLQAVPDELVVVERIQRLREEGRSYAAIAKQLSAEGCSTKRGGRWLPNTVRRVSQR